MAARRVRTGPAGIGGALLGDDVGGGGPGFSLADGPAQAARRSDAASSVVPVRVRIMVVRVVSFVDPGE
ncbi:hypothetical protein B5D80_18320 [Micromonospora wenchangensis]|uniref:Uncharacterized protein n=1 Tax=Micromonospora wenchangensis TaxID=1185415 RepID=A0A246RKY8_9ACTN|nr:hypothetical protein B5D80_18320 [Micromonospora wenchangensis]